MQELVDIVDGAATATAHFRVQSQERIRGAKKGDFPLHFAWNRTGEFDETFGREPFTFDNDSTARFAIIVRTKDHTHEDIETFFKDIVTESIKTDERVRPTQFESYSLQFDGKSALIGVYEMALDTSLCTNG